MSLKIALILSVILQFATAIIAISLIKRTRTNIAWWLISIGFFLMAVRRLFELFQVFEINDNLANGLINSWTGVLISIFMLLSLSFIKRLFNIQKRIEYLKKRNESRVFSAIIRTEENQKQKFSKELHDVLGPLLSSVKMALSSVANKQTTQNNTKVVQNAEKVIDESIITVKEISNTLSPHMLNNFGLDKAIKSFVNKLQIYHKPDINIESNIDGLRFPYTIETVVYRVICELITNSLKHANAGIINIKLTYNTPSLIIEYRDNGNGFDFNQIITENKGFGLTNIQSRLKSVHGNYEIDSKPGEGFKINIEINTQQ